VELPKDVEFGKGNPLLTNKKFMETICPKCNKRARRESDTMDTFVNSSWYYLRYSDSKNNKKIFDSKKANYWAPVDQYIGGPEHITMHLIYIRFYTKFLRDIGLLNFDEPALRYFTQGIIKGSDGEKMSKSRGNVIEPLETIKKYGADSLRLYLVSNSSPDSDFDWDDKGIHSSFKFINKIYDYFDKLKFAKSDELVESKLNKLIRLCKF
jgi:leucyl-tRNA synthetase